MNAETVLSAIAFVGGYAVGMWVVPLVLRIRRKREDAIDAEIARNDPDAAWQLARRLRQGNDYRHATQRELQRAAKINALLRVLRSAEQELGK